jgi:ADP-heptose:LPS heptosyltransferase/predicted SAM-dependent methyltransferase
MTWRLEDPCGNEAGKVKYEIVEYTRGKGLDLGCGPSKAFPHFIGVDSCKDVELFGIQMQPDVVVEDCAKLPYEDGEMDFVFSSHLLEHVQDYYAALAEWWRVLKVGGYLVLYLPHADLYPRIGQPGSNPDHKWDFYPSDIVDVMRAYDCRMLINERRDEGREYSFFQVFKKTDDNEGLVDNTPVALRTLHRKTACVVRYGGFGDMLQASNILPALKRQGYHVTMMTTPKGQEVLAHDQYIAEWFIQDTDQVPNHELPYFWAVQAKRFDKFINLSESVEGTLLAMPGRANHAWPDSVRRKRLGINYLEWTAELAEVPYHSEARFYPSREEIEWRTAYLNEVEGIGKRIGEVPSKRFVILWALAGSSIHKFYPWQDQVIARILLDIPEAVIILTGDYACEILEAGWENEDRVLCESGELSIRQTLALAQVADCVIGPETGVLNAVAFEPVAKVCFLSHSSPENLTKHWINTSALTGNVPCYPCHRLHYGRDFCHEHEATGAAICQSSIPPDRTFAAVYDAYLKWRG